MSISQTRHQSTPPPLESFLDLDSHADTCVLGNNALLVEVPHPPRSADMSFADPSLGTISKPILSGAFKYTSPSDGQSTILVVHQAVYIDTMLHSLLCPMQLQENDIILNECPKSMVDNPSAEHHSLLATTDTNQLLRIPLLLRGVTSTITVTTPTHFEYQTLPWIVLTSPDLTWDPQNPDYAEQEASFLTPLVNLIHQGTGWDLLNMRSLA